MKTVKVVLGYDNGQLAVGTDGYLGNATQLHEGQNIEMHISISKVSPLRVYHYPNTQKIALQEMKANNFNSSKRIYTARFGLLTSRDGVPYASLRHNHMNYVLVGAMDADGKFVEAGRLGIVSQGGEFYLVKRNYEQALMTDEEMPEHLGRVLWYDPFSGVACLRTVKPEPARMYWSRVAANGFVNMKPGDYVAYQGLNPITSPSSKFKWEVQGAAAVLPAKPTDEGLATHLVTLKGAVARPAVAAFQPKLGDDPKAQEVLSQLLGLIK